MPGNKFFLLPLIVIMLSLSHADAWALGLPGGGGARRGGGRGGSSGAKKDLKKEQEERAKEAHKQHVQQMPQAEKCGVLDTSSFDRFEGQLNLNADQKKRLDDLKNQIQSRVGEMEKAQDTARANFTNANERDCTMAGGALMAAIQACKSYAPSKEFESGLSRILTETQRKNFQILKNGGKIEVNPGKQENEQKKRGALKDE